MPRALVLLRTCDNCRIPEERTFTDSWTGLELCLSCLEPIAGDIAMSPQTDSDNLKKLLDIENEKG